MRTANVADADTDDGVNVSVKDYEPDGTWLDYGRDDFERGDEFSYELLSPDVTDLSDIHQIHLLKPGTDGGCIANLALLVDGITVYEQHFGETAATCRWLDDASGHQNHFTIGRATLRAHPSWQAYAKPAATPLLSAAELADRIEAGIGDAIHEDVYVDKFPLYQGDIDVSWTDTALDGERHVKLSKSQTPSAVRVEFELDVDTPGPGGLTGNLSFDLRFTGVCRTATEPAKILMKLENARATADFDWTTEAMTLWLVNLLEGGIADTIAGSLPDFSQIIALDQPVDGRIVKCVTPLVERQWPRCLLPDVWAGAGRWDAAEWALAGLVGARRDPSRAGDGQRPRETGMAGPQHARDQRGTPRRCGREIIPTAGSVRSQDSGLRADALTRALPISDRLGCIE